MRTFVRIALMLLAASVLVGFVWVWSSRSPLADLVGKAPSSSSGEWVGKPAAPTQGTDADGTAFQLSDSLGKVVLLDFWGNW